VGVSQAVDALDLASCGTEVARRAIDALDARPAPMGNFPVVIVGGRGMVMLHEACCHPLEGDEVHRGSIYAGKLGRQVASPLVSVWDDARVPGAVGSYGFDDEGSAGRTTALIRDGVLEGYLTDQLSAQQLDAPVTGNGRCATLLDAPLPRMSNTRLAAGGTDVADIIADTGRGIYAEHIGGGEVVESTGAFVFRVTSGYLIENGRLTAPLEETTLAGYGAEVLTGIDAVGNDSTVAAALCGKFDQLLPVGVIGPTVRVRSLLVGGTVR
jgi:TldD protein